MVSLAKLEGFEWDEGNIAKNWTKHKVAPKECEEVFFNQPLLILSDILHSQAEERFHALGKTFNNRPIFMSYTVRNNKIRIISARGMNKKERKIYEQQ